MRPPPLPLHVTGAIFAAGKSTRMGSDKAFLTLADGTTLVARQAALLRSIHVNDLIISARPHTDYGVHGAHRVYDTHPDTGPLAGIAAALAHSTQPHLLALAVDLPHMTAHFLKSLIEHTSPGIGAVPSSPLGFEPLCAVYPNTPASQSAIDDALASKDYSLQHLIGSAVKAGWMHAVPLAEADVPALANWNTPADMIA
ncbi:MAG: molybdenum cofactor guanylyltransferase [Opitutaceae bacterium]|jgi:molybdopterin-guanine dinucleotide biosynthesis protein A